MAEAPAEAAPKKNLLLPALLVGNSLLLAGVLAVMFLRGGESKASPKAEGGEHEAAAEPSAHGGGGEEAKGGEGGGHGGAGGGSGTGMGPTVKLPDFVVRLRNTDADRYARLTLEVELLSDLDRERLTAFVPRIRDGFILVLSDLTVEELRGSEGLEHLKATLLKKLEEILPNRSVRSLYISDFIVQ